MIGITELHTDISVRPLKLAWYYFAKILYNLSHLILSNRHSVTGDVQDIFELGNVVEIYLLEFLFQRIVILYSVFLHALNLKRGIEGLENWSLKVLEYFHRCSSVSIYSVM